MTRARVKDLHDKVNSLLSMCDLDTPLNGLLLHSDTLCVLSYGGPEDPYEDGQEVIQVDGEDDQEKPQEEDGEEDQTASGGTTARARHGTTATCRRGTTAPTTAPTTVSPGSSWCPRVPSR